MALRPFTRRGIFSHSPCCIGVVCHSRRNYRPEKMAEIRRESLEEKKSLSRKVYDHLGFHPPYLEKSEYIQGKFKLKDKVFTPENHEMYQEEPAFIFNANTRLQEGVSQALSLTKSVLMEEKMPKAVTDRVPSLEIPHMEQRVTDSIKHCRHFDTREKVIKRGRYIYTQILYLLRLSQSLGPDMSLNRSTTEKHYVAASWNREGDQIQVKGAPNGVLVSSRSPLTAAASEEEVEATRDVELPTFEPLAPTLDLLSTNIYKPYQNSTGYVLPHPFPHAHTRLIANNRNWKHSHSVSKAVMYTFADGFSRAKEAYGLDYDSDLETPVVTQGIETNGVNFSFITVQINTLNMTPNEGVKNMVWVDHENPLYLDMYPQDIKIQKSRRMRKNRKHVRELVKKRDPEVGCQNVDVTVFQKFLAFLSNQ